MHVVTINEHRGCGLTESKERCKEALAGRKGEMDNYIMISKNLKRTELTLSRLVLIYFPRSPGGQKKMLDPLRLEL